MIQLMVRGHGISACYYYKKASTREEFESDFVNMKVPDDKQEIARQNVSEANRKALMSVYPSDGREATNYYLKQNARKYYSAGQIPPQNIFTPLAWAEFIKSWKRGDFKSK